MEIFAYADETIFEINKKENIQAVGYGVFISKVPINQNVITEALDNLAKDPDFLHKFDTRTLSNGYFHASDDSGNAHSHLCNSINNNVKGEFSFSYRTYSSNQPIQKSRQERYLDSCLNGSSIEFFNSLDKVNLIIEGRSQISQHSVNQWRDKVYTLFEGISHDLPSMKTFFPKIDITIENKNNPGLQVVDFLSWATARTLRQPHSEKFEDWFKRIKFWASTKDTTENVSQKNITGILNQMPSMHSTSYPLPFVKSQTSEDVIQSYIVIERFIRCLEESDFNPSNIHLWNDLLKAKKICNGLDFFKGDQLQLIGKVFIRLFDSLPIYSNIDNADQESWKALFYAKHIATLLVRNDQIHMNRTQGHIQRWRHHMLSYEMEHYIELVQPQKV
ncbi:MAG: hypothetical protein J0L80_01780 [Chitinophagales bacterium]|nr:hypothetical protein [Chitinophagales bacterium]